MNFKIAIRIILTKTIYSFIIRKNYKNYSKDLIKIFLKENIKKKESFYQKNFDRKVLKANFIIEEFFQDLDYLKLSNHLNTEIDLILKESILQLYQFITENLKEIEIDSYYFINYFKEDIFIFHSFLEKIVFSLKEILDKSNIIVNFKSEKKFNKNLEIEKEKNEELISVLENFVKSKNYINYFEGKTIDNDFLKYFFKDLFFFSKNDLLDIIKYKLYFYDVIFKLDISFILNNSYKTFLLEEEIFYKNVLDIFFKNIKNQEEKIKEVILNWSFDRIDNLDKSILFLAISEKQLNKNIEKSSWIKQYLESSKFFQKDKNLKFINAILDKINFD